MRYKNQLEQFEAGYFNKSSNAAINPPRDDTAETTFRKLYHFPFLLFSDRNPFPPPVLSPLNLLNSESQFQRRNLLPGRNVTPHRNLYPAHAAHLSQ